MSILQPDTPRSIGTIDRSHLISIIGKYALSREDQVWLIDTLQGLFNLQESDPKEFLRQVIHFIYIGKISGNQTNKALGEILLGMTDVIINQTTAGVNKRLIKMFEKMNGNKIFQSHLKYILLVLSYKANHDNSDSAWITNGELAFKLVDWGILCPGESPAFASERLTEDVQQDIKNTILITFSKPDFTRIRFEMLGV